MSRSFGNLIGPVRFGRLASLAVFGAVCALFASGQTEDSNSEAAATVPPPYSLFQYSTLTGSGNAINATWVPALNSKGQTSYYDVTLLFDVDAEGNLTLAPGYPQVVHSPKLTVSSFKAGKYLGPGNV